MLRFVLLAFAFVGVVSVAVYDGVMNYRWTPNVQAEQCAELLDLVPKDIGPWKGQDYETNDEILKVAGAEGHVSRMYVNEETDEAVKLWLIVGPFKHVIRHTPDICYPGNDYTPQASIASHAFDAPGQAANQFNTTWFAKGASREQVFWSWHKPVGGVAADDAGTVRWFASPNSRDNREEYAGTSALFKMYFTTVADPDADLTDNPANDFARVFLPMINQMIASSDNPAAAGAEAKAYADQVGLETAGD